MTRTHTEWGVELTWPDGRTEILERASVDYATVMVDWHNNPDNGSVCTARLARRAVIVEPWQVCPVATTEDR